MLPFFWDPCLNKQYDTHNIYGIYDVPDMHGATGVL